MDSVFEYRQDIVNYINGLEDNETLILSFDQFLYLIVSNNPSDNSPLLDLTKNVFKVVKSEKISCSIKGFKKIMNFASECGLDSFINSELYDLLNIDRLIAKNSELLQKFYDADLDRRNQELINFYNTKKKYIVNMVLEK